MLILSAAGGGGLAAIQVARLLGAEILATAGSDAKRRYLADLGVTHVLPSRGFAFAEGVRAATGGAGVDVVLDHVGGETLDLNLSILRPFGRLVEIGKRDIQEDRGLPLGAFEENLSFSAIDVDRMLAQKPALFAQLLDEVTGLMGQGELSPVRTQQFRASELGDACRTLARGDHIGKVVVRLEDEVVDAEATPRPIRPDAAYLITGGLGGFGAETARWLVAEGARRLVLAGRRGGATPGAATLVADLEAAGARVDCHALDVTDAAAVADLLARIDTGGAPLAGVFHAAAELSDRTIANTAEDDIAAAMGAKVRGAVHLDRLTRDRQLDHFVLYSSVAAAVGNAGQAAYVAANTALEEIAEGRRRLGLPALAVAWGWIGDTGMTARGSAAPENLRRLGIAPLAPQAALGVLSELMAAGHAGVVAVAGVDWPAWAAASAVGRSPRFAGLVNIGAGETGTSEIMALLRDLDPADRMAALVEAVAAQVGAVLHLPADRVGPEAALRDLGLDSLMTVDLLLGIERSLGVRLPAFELSAASVREVAAAVLDGLGFQEGSPSTPAARVAAE